MISKYFYQPTRFSCLRTCVSIVSNIPFEEVPEFWEYGSHSWTVLHFWAAQRGLHIINYEKPSIHPHIGIVGQHNASSSHAVIWADNNIVFDPGKYYKSDEKYEILSDNKYLYGFTILNQTDHFIRMANGQDKYLLKEYNEYKSKKITS